MIDKANLKYVQTMLRKFAELHGFDRPQGKYSKR